MIALPRMQMRYHTLLVFAALYCGSAPSSVDRHSERAVLAKSARDSVLLCACWGPHSVRDQRAWQLVLAPEYSR